MGCNEKVSVKTLDERQLANPRSSNLETDAEHQHHSAQQQMKFRKHIRKSQNSDFDFVQCVVFHTLSQCVFDLFCSVVVLIVHVWAVVGCRL